MRITAALNSAYDQELSKMLKHAKLVRAPTSLAAIEMFEHDGLEAAAGVRQALVSAQKSAKGFHVLPNAYTHIDQAMTIPKGARLHPSLSSGAGGRIEVERLHPNLPRPQRPIGGARASRMNPCPEYTAIVIVCR